MTKTLIALALAAVTATGCMTTQERASSFHEQCASMGFEPGTSGYTQCVYMTNANHEAKMERASMAMMQMGQNMLYPPNQYNVRVTYY